jgi:hypothetical protein
LRAVKESRAQLEPEQALLQDAIAEKAVRNAYLTPVIEVMERALADHDLPPPLDDLYREFKALAAMAPTGRSLRDQ